MVRYLQRPASAGTGSRLAVLTSGAPLGFGPSRKGFGQGSPFGGGGLYLRPPQTEVTHTHLVSEPSPRRWKPVRGLEADYPLVHPNALLPYPLSRSGHNRVGPGCLVALGFRAFPQFGCVAGTLQSRTVCRPTSRGRTPGFKAATFVLTFLTPLASNSERLKDR